MSNAPTKDQIRELAKNRLDQDWGRTGIREVFCDPYKIEHGVAVPIKDQVRTFDTGATRSSLGDKPQYEGYLNPLVIKRFGEYMLKHQIQEDGERRDADNWQKGIPAKSLMDSLWRHFEDVWMHHRGYGDGMTEPIEEALCAMMFNAMAMLLSELKERRDVKSP